MTARGTPVPTGAAPMASLFDSRQACEPRDGFLHLSGLAFSTEAGPARIPIQQQLALAPWTPARVAGLSRQEALSRHSARLFCRCFQRLGLGRLCRAVSYCAPRVFGAGCAPREGTNWNRRAHCVAPWWRASARRLSVRSRSRRRSSSVAHGLSRCRSARDRGRARAINNSTMCSTAKNSTSDPRASTSTCAGAFRRHNDLRAASRSCREGRGRRVGAAVAPLVYLRMA